MTIYNFYMFDRLGTCIHYREWRRDKRSGMDMAEVSREKCVTEKPQATAMVIRSILDIMSDIDT